LLRVSTPIFFRLDPDEMDDVDKVEREKIRTIFQDVADLNDAENLEVYARRALRLQRVARHSTNAAVKALAETEANEIDGDVGAAQSRAAANVVRRRSHKAFLGRAWRPYALFIASLLAFGVSADYLDSERTARITTAKDCAAAIKIVRESAPVTATLLPEICGGAKAAQLVSAPAAPVSSPDAQLAGAVRDLAARYDSCVAAAGAVSSDCATIRAAMRAAIP
jgi:hypothetical protein